MALPPVVALPPPSLLVTCWLVLSVFKAATERINAVPTLYIDLNGHSPYNVSPYSAEEHQQTGIVDTSESLQGVALLLVREVVLNGERRGEWH